MNDFDEQSMDHKVDYNEAQVPAENFVSRVEPDNHIGGSGEDKTDVSQRTGIAALKKLTRFLTSKLRRTPPKDESNLTDVRKELEAFTKNDDFDEFGPDKTPDQRREERIRTAYLEGEIPEGSDFGPDDVDGWYAELPEEEQTLIKVLSDEYAASARAFEEYRNAVRTGLESSAPSLLAGLLPPEQAELVNSPYLLGTHQVRDTDLYRVAQGLKKLEGIDVTGSTLNQRFLYLNEQSEPDFIEYALLGWYGDVGGPRLIAVVPYDGNLRESISVLPDELYYNGELPEDYFTEGEDSTTISAKYVAGIVDDQGNYYPNRGFMRSAKPNIDLPSTPEDTGDWL